MNINLSNSITRNSIIPGQFNQFGQVNQFGQDLNTVRTNYLASWVSPQKSPLRGQQNVVTSLRASSQPPLRTTYLPPSPIHVNPIHFPLTQGVIISQPNFERETLMEYSSKSPLRSTRESPGEY